MSVYDVMIEIKNLPFLPTLTSIKTYNKTASNLMTTNFLYLTKNSTLAHITSILSKIGNNPTTIPIVESNHKK